MTRASLFSACLWAALMATTATAETVQVLGQIVLGETKVSDEKIGEFSSLVRTDAGILAISDRGYIAELAVDASGDGLSRVEVTAVHVLTGPDGVPMRDLDFNPEGAAVLEDGAIAIVSEAGPRLAVFDATGKWLRDEALPEALRDAAQQSSDKDGIETLAWTAATGFVAMTEQPQLGRTRNQHELQTTLAGSAKIEIAGTESFSIKGMEVFGDRLFILERTRDDVTDALYPFVRIIALQDCMTAGACEGRSLPVPVQGITDADFEGLVALDDGLFLMVSDDKIDGDLRSVFVLFRLE